MLYALLVTQDEAMMQNVWNGITWNWVTSETIHSNQEACIQGSTSGTENFVLYCAAVQCTFCTAGVYHGCKDKEEEEMDVTCRGCYTKSMACQMWKEDPNDEPHCAFARGYRLAWRLKGRKATNVVSDQTMQIDEDEGEHTSTVDIADEDIAIDSAVRVLAGGPRNNEAMV